MAEESTKKKEEITKRQMIMAGLATLGTLAVALARIAPLIAGRVQFPASAFFQPEKVRDIADQLPDDEDDFVVAAWDLVARDIAYEPVGSDIDFVDNGLVLCDKCYSVDETLNRAMANCVGKSALMASLLLNRVAPSRVFMAVGQYRNGRVSGHAWVEMERGGQLYLIETTAPPPSSPWKPVSSAPSYVPYAVFSRQEFDCLDHGFCLEVSKCDCGRSAEFGRLT